MWIRTEAFHAPKRGNAESEYEDAFFPESGIAREVSTFRCAVADGASESAFSGLWARLLVRGFGRGRMRLARLRKLWQRAVGNGGGGADTGKQLPWYLEKKVLNGAHAALVGLSLRDGNGAVRPADPAPAGNGTDRVVGSLGGSWRAVAVGDSCVFHVRADELVAVGPVGKSEQFNNSPFLLASKSPQFIRRSDEYVSLVAGRWQPGDTFFLASDAISHWLLAEHEAGRPPWSMLRALGPETFRLFVEKLRTAGVLHNDDSTLMRVEVA